MALSRRSQIKSQKSKSSAEMQYFKEVLTKVGITLQYSDNPNVYAKEASLLRRDIQKCLESHENYPNNIPEFIGGVRHLYCDASKRKYLRKALSPSVLDEAERCGTGKQQECLFRLLLGVDSVQSELVQLLLQEAVAHAVEEAAEEAGWLRLLLAPLRFLPHVRRPQQLRQQLLELLEVGTHDAQLEILSHLPEVLPDSQYEESAPQLVRIMDQNTELVSAIIGCLCCLRLSAQLKEELQDKILAIMCTASSLKTFPMILSFLVAGCRPANLLTVLGRTRAAIHAVMVSGDGDGSGREAERETHQLLTFQELRKLTCSGAGPVADGWLQLLAGVTAPEDHHPVDVLVLLMLHGADRGHRHAVEALVKKKTKAGQLRPDLVRHTLDKYLVPQIYNDYLSSIVALGSCLAGTSGDMSRAFYLGAFFWRKADAPSRQDVLESLMLWGSGGAGAALATLQAIASSPGGAGLLRPHALQLTALIDKLDMITLAETGLMFDFLGAVLWPPGHTDSDSTQNYVLVIIRKQLNSEKQAYRYRGVVSAVSVVRHMAGGTGAGAETGAEEAADMSYGAACEVPCGRAREAALLLELAEQSTRQGAGAGARAFYLDQVAQAVARANTLDPHFVAWLVDAVTADFQELCVVNALPPLEHEPPLAALYNINEREALDENVLVNIAGLVLGPGGRELEVVTLAPMLRLVRVLHQKQQGGSLASVDALLGCGLVLPDADPDSLEAEHQAVRNVLDCTFHAINWFRELVSAFVTQKDKSIRGKVLARIDTLIELEENMKLLLRQLPANARHRFPVVQYSGAEVSVVAGEQGKARAPKRPHDANDTTRVSTQAGSQTQAAKSAGRVAAKDRDFPPLAYRELDTDIILLLKHPLALDEPPNPPDRQLKLNVAQFNFILADLIKKMQIVLKPGSGPSLSHFKQGVQAEDLVRDLVRLMPHVERHLGAVSRQLRALLDKCDGIYDSHDMFLPQANKLKTAFGSILELVSLVLQWPGFRETGNLGLLRELLRALCPGRGEEEGEELRSAQQLGQAVCGRVCGELSELCLSLAAAEHCVRVVRALAALLTERAAVSGRLAGLAGRLLARKWYTAEGMPESGAQASLHIRALVKAHLQHADLNTLSSIVSWVHAEAPRLANKDDHLATFRCLSKATFPLLYRALCAALQEAVRTAATTPGLSEHKHLQVWRAAADTLHGLMDTVRAQDGRSNLGAFLSKSTAVLRLFLSHGLPICELALRSSPDQVVELLKKMQVSTRFLHNLCCHSKVTRERTLVALVPQMRQVLETLVYRVKALLAANNCGDVFWMGNLKNKDLQGEEIASQSTERTARDGEVDEEELPPDSEDEEEDDAVKSASEVYA